MPKQGRLNIAILDNDYSLYSPFGTENTPVYKTRIVAGRRFLVRDNENDPAIQPTKPIASLQQQQNDAQYRKIPKGRYDTTYRREYLNFTQSPNFLKDPTKQQQTLNQYTVLPPITPNQVSTSQENVYTRDDNRFAPSIDHLISEGPAKVSAENYGLKQVPLNLNEPPMPTYLPQKTNRGGPGGAGDDSNSNFLPRQPVQLSEAEENSLMNDVMRGLSNYGSDQLKGFYSELTSYDPNMTGSVHHMYISLVAMRNKLPINDSLLRFIMCKFVQPGTPEPGYVNYEQMVKYLAQCLGQVSNSYGQHQQQQQSYNSPRGGNYNNNTSRYDPTDQFDPDEQAILRLLHENTKDWDKANAIDCDNLRRQFYELDYNKRYIFTQRQIEDVLYKNRIPIQRSLVYQILEKYCKASTGQYKWPMFVDFLERTHLIRNSNGRSHAEDMKDMYASQDRYRATQLDSLRKKVTEEERLEEIERQIYNLQNLKQETQQRIDSRLGDVIQGESWFTRFMRLANAMYSHRVNAGIEFLLPKDEARRLINAYNTVYDLKVPESVIEDGLNKCTRKGNVLIDDLLKVLAKVN